MGGGGGGGGRDSEEKLTEALWWGSEKLTFRLLATLVLMLVLSLSLACVACGPCVVGDAADGAAGDEGGR